MFTRNDAIFIVDLPAFSSSVNQNTFGGGEPFAKMLNVSVTGNVNFITCWTGYVLNVTSVVDVQRNWGVFR